MVQDLRTYLADNADLVFRVVQPVAPELLSTLIVQTHQLVLFERIHATKPPLTRKEDRARFERTVPPHTEAAQLEIYLQWRLHRREEWLTTKLVS